MALGGLVAGDAGEVARAYGLGTPTGRMRPVARGELGRVWRLPTSTGPVAVKDLFFPPAEAGAAADAAFQLEALAAGVVLPAPRRTPGGRVLAELASGVTVRAYEWMDLTPLGERPVEQVGALLATLHRLTAPTAQPRHPWYVQPVGEPAWTALLADLEAADAPFSDDVAGLLPEVLALEALLPTPLTGDERRCHLDLDDSNLARDDRGRLVVLDWENSGPAAPSGELAMVAAEYGPAAAVRLVRAYRAGGGPATLREPADFAVAAAVQGHLVETYARRWLRSGDPAGEEDRQRCEWQIAGIAAQPVTRARIDEVLAALR
ncbi:MAG: phosphotransferase enzyme family protein [Mycobacteriales bacterium]